MSLAAIDSYAGGAYATCCLATGARLTFLAVDDIVGIHRLEGNAHYAGKREQERLIGEGRVP